jgi:site-specific recombinase XerD
MRIPTSDLGEEFGAPEMERLPLILKIKDVLEGRLSAGGSRTSAKTAIDTMRKFYSWADETGITLTLENVAPHFLSWSETLILRVRLGAIKHLTAYGMACIVSGVLDEVFSLEQGLIRQTRLRRRVSNRLPPSVDVEQAFAFGHALCDVCDALTPEVIRGSLPILIRFRTGHLIEHWSGLRAIEKLKNKPSRLAVPNRIEGVMSMRHAWELDTSNRTRKSVINLRIQAEMLIFVAQTGMNAAQVRTLTVGRFSYQSHSNGYLVRRIYKDRKKGEVEFEIYAEYRIFFERYLSWIRAIFPDREDDLLFPLISTATSQRRSLNGVCENLKAVRSICKRLDINYVIPRDLRKARINWLARRSGDLDQTAEMAQHSREVLLRNYLAPDPQVAAGEITRFFQQQNQASHMAPGPGACIEPLPSPVSDMPKNAPAPDCVSPSGCMFCSHHRDIDSLDHMWSLTTYRYLKTMVLATTRSY